MIEYKSSIFLFCFCSNDAILIVTISQIALSAALIMGIAALLVLWYRMCTRTNYLSWVYFICLPYHFNLFLSFHLTHRNAYMRSETEHCCNRDFAHASLTSVQIRIMSRLRDRPPTYEVASAQQEEGQVVRTISYGGPASEIQIISGRAPPCYDGAILSVRPKSHHPFLSYLTEYASSHRSTISPLPTWTAVPFTIKCQTSIRQQTAT